MKHVLPLIILLAGTLSAMADKHTGITIQDIPELLSLYTLQSDKQTYFWNPEDNYRIACQLDSLYESLSGSNQEKMAKAGCSDKQIFKRIKRASEGGLQFAQMDGTKAAYEHFLRVYTKAPMELKNRAKELLQYAPEKPSVTSRPRTIYTHDEAWQLTHKAYVSTGRMEDLMVFAKRWGYSGHPAVEKKDLSIIGLYPSFTAGKMDTTEMIRLAAPYRFAYKLLLEQLQADVRAKRFQQAYAKAAAYQTAFGNDHSYRDLLRVLAAPYDPNKVPKPLPPTVNTSMREYGPIISGDGQTLYFCRVQHNETSYAEGLTEDIWMSRMTDNGWGEATLIQELSTDMHNEAPESVTTDGTTLLVFIDGQCYFTDKAPKGWGGLFRLPNCINKTSDWVADVRISADGKSILFAARSQLFGQLSENANLYVSVRNADGSWATPMDLGPVLNSGCNERSPILHPDMQTLYFTSDGHGSLGSFDVFRTRRLNPNSWTEWSEPENVGTIVNTPDREEWYQVSTDGSFAMISSGKQGFEDIYSLPLSEDMKPNPVATLCGKMLSQSGQPMDVLIHWEDLTTGEDLGFAKTDPSDGSYFVALPLGHQYGYYVEGQDIFPTAANVDLRGITEAVRICEDIEIVSLGEMKQTQQEMVIKNLFFEVDKWDILPESEPELRRMAALIKAAACKVEISGHADKSGYADKNLILSQNRANAVREYLISLGCEASLLTATGYGDTRPIATNDTDEGRQQNRRVTVKFTR